MAAVLNFMVARGSMLGTLFKWSDNYFMTRENFVTSIQSALSAAGHPTRNYGGHSFHIGAATICIAARNGVQNQNPWPLGELSLHLIHTYITGSTM